MWHMCLVWQVWCTWNLWLNGYICDICDRCDIREKCASCDKCDVVSHMSHVWRGVACVADVTVLMPWSWLGRAERGGAGVRVENSGCSAGIRVPKSFHPEYTRKAPGIPKSCKIWQGFHPDPTRSPGVRPDSAQNCRGSVKTSPIRRNKDKQENFLPFRLTLPTARENPKRNSLPRVELK